MNQASEENQKVWLLSAPLDLIAAAVSSAVAATSSTRRILGVCFPCGRGFRGCFEAKESFDDGAWFDCDKLQADYPNCYSNPTPVTEAEDDPRPRERASTESSPYETSSQPRSASAGIIIEPAAVTTVEVESPPSAGGDLQSPKSRRPKFKKYRSRLVKSSFFASNLEQDRDLGCRKDSIRAEGKIRSPPIRRSDSDRFSDHKPSIRSPILQRNNVPPINVDFVDCFSWDGDSLDSDEGDEDFQKMVFGEVWSPSELEDAFEVYNDFALRSFGFQSQSAFVRGSPSRTSNEKFEDFFPLHFNKSRSQDNSSIDATGTRFQDRSSSCSSSNDATRPCCEPEGEFKSIGDVNANLIEKSSADLATGSTSAEPLSDEPKVCRNALELAEAELRDFISVCLLIDDVSEANKFYESDKNYKFHCDKLLTFCGKSFKRNLIFDLVKQATEEYFVDYKSAVLFRSEIPVSLIQDKVLKHFQFNMSCQNSESLISKDIQAVRHNMLISNSYEEEFTRDPHIQMIKTMTSQEVLREGRLWQDIEEEKYEVKVRLADDIFTQLLNSELEIISAVLKNKEMSLQGVVT